MREVPFWLEATTRNTRAAAGCSAMQQGLESSKQRDKSDKITLSMQVVFVKSHEASEARGFINSSIHQDL